MSVYTKTKVTDAPRTELHDVLSLTGAEISINNLPAGTGVPFVHSHRENEEIYFILNGSGKAVINGETVKLEKGDALRLNPEAERQFSAAEDCSLSFMCIQVKKDSLSGYTQSDAVIV